MQDAEAKLDVLDVALSHHHVAQPPFPPGTPRCQNKILRVSTRSLTSEEDARGQTARTDVSTTGDTRPRPYATTPPPCNQAT
eukprot:2883459-Rhodomonas_salina.1